MVPVSADVDKRLRARLLRRWRIGVVGLLVTIALCAGAATLVPATYKAKGLVLLTPPATTTGPNAQANPYLALVNLQPLADVLGRVMTDPATKVALRARGFRGSFTVVRDVSTDGPILDVAVNGPSSAQAMKDLNLVLESAAPALEQLQASESVAVGSRAAAQAFASDLKASPSAKSQTRALVVAAGFGIVGTLLAVVGMDNLALRRRRRRAKVTHETNGAGTGLSGTPAKPRPLPRSRPRPRPYKAPGEALSEIPTAAGRSTTSGVRSGRAGSAAAVTVEPAVAEYAGDPEHPNTSTVGASADGGNSNAVDDDDDLFVEFDDDGASDLPPEAGGSESISPPARTTRSRVLTAVGVRPLVRARMNGKRDPAQSRPAADHDDDRSEVSVTAAGQGASPDR